MAMRGVDISEHNGHVDFDELKENGIEFVIVRLGYGNGHQDDKFLHNVFDALATGMKVGIYYYSYALTPEAARAEAEFALEVLTKNGYSPADFEMGIWFDMEDADDYKAMHGMPDRETITAICSAFIVEFNKAGYSCGIYASLDWLENKIDTDALADYVPYWPAQWGNVCDWQKNTKIWQYTECLEIDGRFYDGDLVF